MHRAILIYCGVLLTFLILYHIGGYSQTVSDCRAFRECVATQPRADGRSGCDSVLKWTKCNGANGSSFGGCLNEGCISGCACGCEFDAAGKPTARTFSWFNDCTETVGGQRSICGGCPECPTPNRPPPNGRTDCLWIKSRCDWACGPIADITPSECEEAGGIWSFIANTCSTGGGNNPGVCTGEGTLGGGGNFEPNEGEGSTPPDDMGCTSPVLLDVNGDGFALTDAAGGVLFDLNGNGWFDGRLAWTATGADDAWLALDRDGDGAVTTGHELFGNFTPQPDPPAGEGRNGFLALAEFDTPAQGGNSDGVIDGEDAVFARLRLWQDINHDGVSQAEELHTLPSLGLARLHLRYKESRRVDGHGNRFKYRAKVDDARGARVNRWAWDVFLVSQ
jgi:hypothetical protein